MTESKLPIDVAEQLRLALIAGDKGTAVAATSKALNLGVNPLALVQDVIVPALTLVGERFESLDIFLPELMAAGEAGNACTALIEQEITKSGKQMQSEGTVVIGTVKGDIHDIGKNIVASLLKAQGFKVVDIGKDVPATVFLDAAESNKADVIAASALMSITRTSARDIAILMDDRNLKGDYFLVVGGGSITQEYADEIGADGFAETGSGAVEIIKSLMFKKKGA
jgi:5-methyltetrahydrofolate--homocysteine methyltransferase